MGGYQQSSVCALTVPPLYSLCTHCTYTIYSMHSLHLHYTLYALTVPTLYTLCTHCTSTIYSMHSLYLHYTVPPLYTLCTHCTSTIPYTLYRRWVPPNYWYTNSTTRDYGSAYGFATEISPGAAPMTMDSMAKTMPGTMDSMIKTMPGAYCALHTSMYCTTATAH
jgi:hypothetical protein